MLTSSSSNNLKNSAASERKPASALNGAVKTMRELWGFALSRPPKNLPTEDGFFEMGGNSLSAMKLINAINRKFFTAIPTEYLLSQSSVRGFLDNLSSVGHNIEVIPKLSQSDATLAPPSLLQESFFRLQKRDPLFMANNLTEFFSVEPDFNFAAFEAALRRVVRRHESLRTLIRETENGTLRLEVTIRSPEFEHIQLKQDEMGQKAQLREYAHRPYDLSADLPIRAALFESNGELRILALGFHHVTTDGWSLDIMLRELCALYKNNVMGMESIPISFKDYAAFQRTKFSQIPPHSSIEFWKSYLRDFKPLRLPTTHPRPVTYLNAGITQEFELSEDVSTALRALAMYWDVSLFSLLLSTYFLFLGRITGQGEVSIATSVANREHFQLEHLVGLLSNDIPLRQKLSAELLLREFVENVSEDLHTAREHGGVPFPRIMFAAGISPNEHRSAEEWIPAFFQLMDSKKEMSIPLESHAASEDPQLKSVMNYELWVKIDSTASRMQVILFGAQQVLDQKSLHEWSELYLTILNQTVEGSCGEHEVPLTVGNLTRA